MNLPWLFPCGVDNSDREGIVRVMGEMEGGGEGERLKTTGENLLQIRGCSGRLLKLTGRLRPKKRPLINRWGMGLHGPISPHFPDEMEERRSRGRQTERSRVRDEPEITCLGEVYKPTDRIC